MIAKTIITYTNSGNLMKRELARLTKEGLREVGTLWWKNYMPGHFELSAKQKYEYRDRTKKYMITKSRIKGHGRPLEFTGDMKKQMMRMARLSGTSKKVTVTMTAPTYAKYHNKLREVTKVTHGEALELAHAIERFLQWKLESLKENRIVRAG